MTALEPDVVVLVLAAGEGTRMRSATPKVLHEIGGRSLLGHVLAAVEPLKPRRVVVVIGHGREQVRAHLSSVAPEALPVVQDTQHGTGHAVRVAIEQMTELGEPLGDDTIVLVLAGDTPLLETSTVADLLAEHVRTGARATVLTAELNEPTGYGRILRNAHGAVTGIVEQRDATPDQAAMCEVNSAIYAFSAAALVRELSRLTTDNSQGEEYLTDVLGQLVVAGELVGAVVCADAAQISGVNDRVQLAAVRALLRDRVAERWMRGGVTVIDPRTTWIDVTATFEPDVVVLPNTQLHGSTHLSTGAQVGPDCTLTDTMVGVGAHLVRTVASGAVLHERAAAGPFTFLRPGTVLHAGARAGGFVETKNAVIGEGSKVPHLSYVGDAEIGEHTNIGAATVFVNYDGENKHRSVVGSHVRIGSDTMLVAPVTIGDGAYTAAGSVIIDDVPPGAMAVGRGRQKIVEGWVQRRRAGSDSATAANAAIAAANSANSTGKPSDAGEPPPRDGDTDTTTGPSDAQER